MNGMHRMSEMTGMSGMARILGIPGMHVLRPSALCLKTSIYINNITNNIILTLKALI